MQIDPGIFKAYDIRGIYPNQLNEEAAYAIGRAFATFLKVDTVIVGRDMRLSGPQIFDAVTRGLMDQGTDVINIGMVMAMLPVVGMPLPLFSYGGSSVLTIMIGIGLLMNVSMRRFTF